MSRQQSHIQGRAFHLTLMKLVGAVTLWVLLFSLANRLAPVEGVIMSFTTAAVSALLLRDLVAAPKAQAQKQPPARSPAQRPRRTQAVRRPRG